MKKIYSLLCTALLLIGLTACEDVPAPYEINEDGPTDGKVLLSETFASSLGKFQNITSDGGIEWVNSYSCATATGYDNSTKTNTAGTCYLVSPEVDLEGVDTAHVSYDYILRYKDQDDYQKLLIIESENYNSATVNDCPWTTVFASHVEGSDYTTFAKADVNVPQAFYGKKVRFALRFQAGTKSATWEVKNFKVQRGEAGGDGPIEEEGLFNKSFSSDLAPFVSYTTAGEGGWIIDYSTAKATGYDNASQTTTAGTYYLVSPAISLADIEKAYVDYNYILRYNKGNSNQQLLISTSFDSANPAEGWTVLNENHTEGTDWATFANSAVQIPEEYIGQTIYLAFKYNTDDKSGSTWEVKNITIYEGDASDKPTPGPIEGGTADNPLTVAQLQALFDANSIPSAKIYVKGIVSEVQEISTSYGNATYFISDDGTTAGQFEVYRGYALDGNKFTAEDQLQVGDEVIVYGQVVLYNKTREFTTGSQLYYSSRLGQGGGDTPTPPGPTPDPVNLDDFQNGDFETWEGGLPTHWKSTSTASSATLSQSADAHGGNYSVCVEGTTSANKRLAYEEMTLAAGTYIVKFFVKAESAAASVCPGYVPVVDGKVGSYAYGDYVNDIPSDTWTEVTHQFTLTATTTVNLVVMNSKKYGANVLIDDFTISTVPSAKKRK